MALYWAGTPQQDTQETIKQMKAFNCNDAQINEFLKHNQPQHCEVLEENWQALKWFLTVDDLFRTNQHRIIGLDIQAIKADADMRGLEYTPEDYEKLRHIGRIATKELNKD